MPTLIAEDLLLLMLDDRNGSVVGTSYLRTALGGAVLIELALDGSVTIDEKSSLWRSPRVRVTPHAEPDEPLLRDALVTISEKERSAQDLVDRLGKGLKGGLTSLLVERGIVERRHDKVLGLFPRTRWPVVDPPHERAMRHSLGNFLVQGVEPDPRTAALIALLSAIDRAHKVVEHRGVSSGQVRKRAREIAHDHWAAKAVKDAISAASAGAA